MYNRPVAVVHGSSDAGPSTHARFYEPICSQLPACDDEVPHTRGFMPRHMFDNTSSPKHTFVGGKKHEEIDELLLKVLKLTEDLPTSGDRLRTVAGFFPVGHGPRDEDIVAAHNFDCGVIESLKIAVTNVRSSYAQLRHSQEEKCVWYEKDAGHILDEMNRQDAGVGADNVCSRFFVALNLFCVLCGLLLTIFVFCVRLEWNLLVSMEQGTMELVRYKYFCHVCSAMRPSS